MVPKFKREDVVRPMAAGLAATLGMSLLMALMQAAGFPRVDIAALVVEPVVGHEPAMFSGWWWLGFAVHLAFGSVVFPLLFLSLFEKPWVAKNRLLFGWLLGMALFVVGEGVFIPLSGHGFFSSGSSRASLTVLQDFIAHSSYGLLLGALIRPHRLAFRRRHEA